MQEPEEAPSRKGYRSCVCAVLGACLSCAQKEIEFPGAHKSWGCGCEVFKSENGALKASLAFEKETRPRQGQSRVREL